MRILEDRWHMSASGVTNLHDGEDNPEAAHQANVNPGKDVAQGLTLVQSRGCGGRVRRREEVILAIGGGRGVL